LSAPPAIARVGKGTFSYAMVSACPNCDRSGTSGLLKRADATASQAPGPDATREVLAVVVQLGIGEVRLEYQPGFVGAVQALTELIG
jgi:hypothetical protein